MSEGESFVLVYSVNSRDSFDVLFEFADLICRHRDVSTLADVPVVIVANKTDLEQEEWQVTSDEGRAFAKRLGAPFVEASAKSGKNAVEAFETVVKEVLRDRAQQEADADADKKMSRRRRRQQQCAIL